MTPAPLGKVRTWKAEPWPSSDGQPQLLSADNYGRAVACVNALAGVAEPVETMQRVKALIQDITGDHPCSSAILERYGPGIHTEAASLLLTLTGGRQ